MPWVVIALLTACAGREPEYTRADFDLVGVWALEDEEAGETGVPSDTQIEFVADGTWALLDAGERCDEGPFYSWYCEGPGTWSLDPAALLADEDTTLAILEQDDEEPVMYEAWFDSDPDHFCWKQQIGQACLVRL